MDATGRAVNRPLVLNGVIRLVLIVGLGCASGCSEGRVAAVDASGARQALLATLESWKKGDPIGSMKTHNPSIVAQDMDWEAGHKLMNFDVLDEGKDEVLNLRIPVSLMIREKAGTETKKKVKYMVGTSPVITVFREIF